MLRILGMETKEVVNSYHENEKMDPIEAIRLISTAVLMLM